MAYTPGAFVIAADIVVGPAGTASDFTTLADAFAALPAEGGSIFLHRGTYSLSSAASFPAGKPVVLRGSGADDTIVDIGSNVISAFLIPDDEQRTVEDLSIVGNSVGGQAAFEFGNSAVGAEAFRINRVKITAIDDIIVRTATATPYVSCISCTWEVPNISGANIWNAGAGTFNMIDSRITYTGVISSKGNISGAPDMKWTDVFFNLPAGQILVLAGKVEWTKVTFVGGQITLGGGADESSLIGCNFAVDSGTVGTHIQVSGSDRVTIMGCIFDANATTADINVSTTSQHGRWIGNYTPAGILDSNTSGTQPSVISGNVAGIERVSSQISRTNDKSYRTTTTSLTLDFSYRRLAITTTTQRTITLPDAAVYRNYEFTIKHQAASGTHIVDTTGADTIEGLSSILLNPGDSITVQADGGNWYIV